MSSRPWAAIDVGSNSCQLLIAREVEGQLVDCLERIETIRLAQDLQSEHREIGSQAIERLQNALVAFAEVIRNTRSHLSQVVFTEVLRRADNAQQILDLSHKILRIEAQIISGEEEARLSYLGVCTSYPDLKCAVMDIGAGSIELATDLKHLSLPLGVLRMSQEFGTIPGSSLIKYFKETLKAQDLKPFAKRPLVLSGGTAHALAWLLQGANPQDIKQLEGFVVDLPQVEDLCQRLGLMSEEVRSRMPGLQNGRSQIILPGLRAIQVYAQMLKSPQVLISLKGLKHGLLQQVLRQSL